MLQQDTRTYSEGYLKTSHGNYSYKSPKKTSRYIQILDYIGRNPMSTRTEVTDGLFNEYGVKSDLGKLWTALSRDGLVKRHSEGHQFYYQLTDEGREMLASAR